MLNAWHWQGKSPFLSKRWTVAAFSCWLGEQTGAAEKMARCHPYVGGVISAAAGAASIGARNVWPGSRNASILRQNRVRRVVEHEGADPEKFRVGARVKALFEESR